MEKIQTGLSGSLTLISAPPGYGKSSLLSEFVNQYQSAVIWYTVDGKDNHPSIFFHDLVTAVNRVIPSINLESITTTVAKINPKEAFTHLITQFSRLDPQVVLILDDFHLINDPLFLEDFAFFTENIPPQLHLIMATRSDPPFPLSKMRVRGLLTEIRTLDLAFNEQDIITFFSKANQINISRTEADLLAQLTDGWPASLQMASISLQKHGDFQKLLHSLQGNNRFILDYLIEEVLNRQPETIKKFLYTTSILEKMNAALCDQLMAANSPNQVEIGSSQPILEQLEQNNLFLIPLDEQRTWYRYHHLFADLLRIRQEKQDKQQITKLHDLAASWFEEQNMIREAVHHAHLSGNPKRIETSLAKNAIAMIYNGQLTKLAEWINTIPNTTLIKNPWLLVAKAWFLSAVGETRDIETILQQVESLLQQGENIENESHLLLQIAILRFYLSVIRDDLSAIQHHLGVCQSNLIDSDPVLHGFVLNLFTTSLRLNGHIHYAEQTAHKALYISRQSNDLYMILDSYLHLAHVYLDRGKLNHAAETCLQAIHFAQEKTAQANPTWVVSLGNIYAIYSQILWEWNQLTLGLSYAQKAVKLSRQWGQPNSLAFTHYTLAKLLQANGYSTEATEAIQIAYQVSEKISPQYHARKSRQIAMFHFAQNDFQSAAHWVNQIPAALMEEINPLYFRTYVAVTKIWLALDQNQKALDFLKRWLPAVHQSDLEARVLEAEILRAIANWQIGKKKEALTCFEAVLKRAKPEGYLRTFLILGKPPVRSMLQECQKAGIYPEYVSLLLQALDPTLTVKDPPEAGKTEQSYQKLSDREVQVLRYLQTNLTLPEIAQELNISTHTIRSHTKNIYAKLDVNRRGAAVNFAKAQKII